MIDLSNIDQLLTGGLIQGIENEAYHAGPGVSKSQLDLLTKSPAHYIAGIAKKKDPTPAMVFGTLFHSFILEPETTKIVVAPAINKRTNAGKAELAEFEASNAGSWIVDQDEHDKLVGMKAAIESHGAAAALLGGQGINEASAYWIDVETGALCRCRPDRVTDRIIVDLKTADDASPTGFAKAVANFRYHVQAAFYTDGVTEATGLQVHGFAFVVVEKCPPYAVAVYQLDAHSLNLGRFAYQQNLRTLATCALADTWPGYSPRIETLSLPAWSAKEALNG